MYCDSQIRLLCQTVLQNCNLTLLFYETITKLKLCYCYKATPIYNALKMCFCVDLVTGFGQ